MNEPRRWTDDGATDAERRLLSSWRDEQPSARARTRVLGLLSAGAAATGATSTVAATGGGAALGKSILIGALVGAVIVGVSEVVPRRSGDDQPRPAPIAVAPPPPPTPNANAPVRRPAPAKPEPAPQRPASVPRAAVPLPAPPADTPSPPADTPTTTDALPSPAPPPSAPRLNLLAQVASLDRARSALAGGDTTGCLSLLDAHEAAFPGGALAQEAALLRIEALVRLGRRSEAAALARAFADAHPGSPDVAKVRGSRIRD